MDDSLGTFTLETLEQFVRLQNEQDLPGILRLIHESSFSYQTSAQMLMNLFATWELRYTLLDSRFVAGDGEFAFARLTVSTEKLAGPDFANHTAESLVAFRRLQGQWKIWCQMPLTMHLHG